MSHEHTRRNFVRNAGVIAGSTLLPASSPKAAPTQGASNGTARSTTARFRSLMARPEPLVLPVIPDVLVARLCEMEGFQAVFIGGSWASYARYGIPDIG